MAVETLTEFPRSFVAGDTIRVAISDSRFPSSAWTLKVLFQSATAVKSFSAPVGTGTGFLLTITAAQSADIPPGFYSVALAYTETATGERQTDDENFAVQVFANPAVAAPKSVARLTLEAMESALQKLAGGSDQSFSCGGASFTKKNIGELQKAIEQQRVIVAGEDAQRAKSGDSLGRILHPL